mmetsp:Transcript_21228/g.58979  ORF Transcript_21228/g.58979 Transcript_21228/m.58979 type:complete len:543 (+) Transcript_21228:177-1805(+)
MGTKRAKSAKGKGKKTAELGYFEATLLNIFSNVAEKINHKEQREADAARVIVAFLQGHRVRRAAPGLSFVRQRIYVRNRTLRIEREQAEAATAIQTQWRSHKSRSSTGLNTKKAAAVKLQSHMRGHLTRKHLKEDKERNAAITIQKHQRGKAARERVATMLDERHAKERWAASIAIQRHFRGWRTRRWYVRLFDQRACCTCNSLADSDVIICNDCYEVYHVACAGYSSDHRPAPNKPWYCHFCVASKAQHTVFVQRRRPGAPQSLVRLHVSSAEDKQRLEAIAGILAAEVGTATASVAEGAAAMVTSAEQKPVPRQMAPPTKHNLRLEQSRRAQDRLTKCRAKTTELGGYRSELQEKVASLTAESANTYIGPPPPTAPPRPPGIPALPVLNLLPPHTLLPAGPHDGRSTADTMASHTSKRSLHSLKSTGMKSVKAVGRSKRRLGAPSKRLADPLHDRKPKIPAYLESREEQFNRGVFSRKDVLSMRVSMKTWQKNLFGLDAVPESQQDMTEPFYGSFREIPTLTEDDMEGMPAVMEQDETEV